MWSLLETNLGLILWEATEHKLQPELVPLCVIGMGLLYSVTVIGLSFSHWVSGGEGSFPSQVDPVLLSNSAVCCYQLTIKIAK